MADPPIRTRRDDGLLRVDFDRGPKCAAWMSSRAAGARPHTTGSVAAVRRGCSEHAQWSPRASRSASWCASGESSARGWSWHDGGPADHERGCVGARVALGGVALHDALRGAHVARRGRPAPALDDDGRLRAGQHAGLGSAGRGARLGDPPDPARSPACGRAAAGLGRADVGGRRPVRPALPPAAGGSARGGDDAAVAGHRGSRRDGVLRSHAPTVARGARRGARGRPDGLRVEAASQPHRRAGRDPARRSSPLPHARAVAR